MFILTECSLKFFFDSFIFNTEFNDLRNIICLIKIVSLMFQANLRSMACIAEVEWVHSSVTMATRTFRFIPNIAFLWSYQAIKV